MSIQRIEREYAINQEFIHATNKRRKIRLLPAMSTYTSSLYYNSEKKVEFFQNLNLNYFSSNGSIKTEVAAAYYFIFRTDISTVLSKTKVQEIDPSKIGNFNQDQLRKEVVKIDSTNKSNSTLNKIVSGGGEAMLSIRTPLVSIFSNQRRAIAPRFTSELIGNFSLDLPVAKTYVDGNDATYFSMWGLDNDFSIPLIKFDDKRDGYQAIALASKVVIKNVHGSSDFYNNLGSSSKKGFWMREFYFGIDAGPVMIYYTTQSFSNANFKNQQRFGLAFNKQF
ncbi:hypothetical protein BXP70_25890 [Hymenobacter crusticola]|uniref:Uncharacterized protein n=1 Tax=Hymenobacter crusticola TaxID=1770526 RepID=A0A243W6T7_9BACT|nr:hypothetical protein BXP70_25890 [Hymenobacter crusticola]